MPEIQAPSPNGDGNAVDEALYLHYRDVWRMP